MFGTIQKEWQAKFAVILFVLLSVFWLLLQTPFFNGQMIFGHSYQKFFGAIYGLVALWGGVWGIIFSKEWGGTRSLIGKAMIVFSIGLFAQEFGQASYSYIDYVLHIQGAYPSI